MYILGIMSGTSLDGIDLALCSFSEKKGKFDFEIHRANSLAYPAEWQKKLSTSHSLPAFDLIKLHKDYGFFIGKVILDFLKDIPTQAHYIASHGHTVFHQPNKSVTFQIGDGAAIAALCGIPVISDFRNLDVCLGGQGAPLVPIGDEMLFSEYDYCLNLGGFSNVSFNKNGIRKAFDICPVNIVLNEFAQKAGKDFDKAGELGTMGHSYPALVAELDNLEYYKRLSPKSLGREWLEKTFLPIIKKYNISIPDIMASLYEHISNQLATVMEKKGKKILITGGGAFNTYLLEQFQKKTNCTLIIPNSNLVNFKEALVFAFLGYLHINNKPNCLTSVTGAKRDSIGGCIFK
ncbi:MAG: anhydro-N-acetylmuramic acid kinase [Bacteroidota bacterium]|nr:anhydro-N-acetylmuramic acid kinase [Bacteroidota bacterium]